MLRVAQLDFTTPVFSQIQNPLGAKTPTTLGVAWSA